MKIHTANVIELKRKLYQKYKDFNKFQDIDEAKQEELRRNISFLTANYQKLDLYIKMLELLVCDYKTNLTFDEKMFCLIEACDPNLDYLRIFNRFGNPKKGEIEFEQYLNEARKLTGFADDNLRKFENFYLRTIVFNKVPEEQGKKLSRTQRK
jgi:hypothetical protein